jgi:transmembrane sensor
MSHLDPQDFIDQYLAGELDQPTAEWVRLYLEAYSGRSGVVAGVRASVRSEHIANPPEVHASRERLFAKLDAAERSTHRSRQQSRQSQKLPGAHWYARWTPVAGICAVVLVAMFGWQLGTHKINTKPAPVVTYTTARGERATITLPDGSTAMLNVASRLEVPVDYATGNRAVHLTGAALFTVTHHDGSPFTVVAGANTARVLGTSFVVRHYASDSMTTVAVREGKVAVRSTVLTGGHQVAVGPHGTSSVQAANASEFSFVSGLLTLTNLPLPAAIPELNRWYDADIRLGDRSLADRRITGSYDTGSLAELQMILEMTFNVRVVRDGRTLTLFPR